jgi:exopolysaccharide biosynthesis predicted pyruvyltransferase EpsI
MHASNSPKMQPSIRGAESDDLVQDLQRQIHANLLPILNDTREVALVDFPNYSNVGDSLIWLGELAYLRSVRVRIRYAADMRTYSKTTLERKVGAGPILISGGGNFGDIWPAHQEFRYKVMRDFPKTPIIQLPQSIHFEDKNNLHTAADRIGEHRNFTLCVRDAKSRAIAQEHFRCPVVLCPDMAFALGHLERLGNPDMDVVWLRRTDKESMAGGGSRDVPAMDLPDGWLSADWLDEPVTLLARVENRLNRTLSRHPDRFGSLEAVARPIWNQRARQRLDRGRRLLSRGRLLVSDRLHGHILAVLLGMPQVLIDNSYGKLSSFHEMWTHGAPSVTFARSAREAIECARELSASAAD